MRGFGQPRAQGIKSRLDTVGRADLANRLCPRYSRDLALVRQSEVHLANDMNSVRRSLLSNAVVMNSSPKRECRDESTVSLASKSGVNGERLSICISYRLILTLIHNLLPLTVTSHPSSAPFPCRRIQQAGARHLHISIPLYHPLAYNSNFGFLRIHGYLRITPHRSHLDLSSTALHRDRLSLVCDPRPSADRVRLRYSILIAVVTLERPFRPSILDLYPRLSARLRYSNAFRVLSSASTINSLRIVSAYHS
ncbi:hypothetical protein PHSY_002949 [Pseudozyma hubeiensis SY62]|uniref:Uncharacterized protein n=1 Tax=Pseudozyma hubeiensis (strain SY62) TaxID=1305764 RepID=R9P2B0_PSEHS|nr:hypothetical protein PHSY_002949 [Pseudozyma hubeiensis SY62]GAC95374.1 hypothetical protein PHSY_002949 [Pseudozyma hubeiensis SY62]